jgi:hypothetical protein
MNLEPRSSIYDLLAHWGPTGLMMSFLRLPDLLPLRLSATATANAVNIHIRGVLHEELLQAISRDYRKYHGVRYRISQREEGDSPESVLEPERVEGIPSEPSIFVIDVASALPLSVMPRCDVPGLIFLLKTVTQWLNSSSLGEGDGRVPENALSTSDAEPTSTSKVRREFADNFLQSIVELAEVRTCLVPSSADVSEEIERGVAEKGKGSKRRRKAAKKHVSDPGVSDEATSRNPSSGCSDTASVSVADIILWPHSCPVYQLLSHWASKKRFCFKGEKSKTKKHRTDPLHEALAGESSHYVKEEVAASQNSENRNGEPLLIEKVVEDFAPLFQVREAKSKKKRNRHVISEDHADGVEGVSPWLGRPTPDLYDTAYILNAVSDDRDRFPLVDPPRKEEAPPIDVGALEDEFGASENPLARHDSSESNDATVPVVASGERDPSVVETTHDESPESPIHPPPACTSVEDPILDLNRLEGTKFFCQTGTWVVSKRYFTGSQLNQAALLINVSRIHVCHVSSLERIENGFLSGRYGLVTIILAHLPNLAGIGERFLEKCTALRSVHIVDCPMLSVLGAHFLKEAVSLCSWTLPSSITGVGGSFLESCRALRGVNLSHMKISALGSGSLAAASLLSIQLPKSLQFIGDGVLAGSNLRCVDLTHTNCVSIGATFLAQSTALENLALPRTLTGIGPKFLHGCSKIRHLDLTRTQLRMVGDEFCGRASRLESVKFPSTMLRLPPDTFSRLVGEGCGPLLDFSSTSILSAVIPVHLEDRFIMPWGFKNRIHDIPRDVRPQLELESDGEG